MIIDITRLRSNYDKSISIDEEVKDISDNLEGTDIKKIKNLKVTGYIDRDVLDEEHIYLKIEGTLILECAITLKDVEYPISVEIDDNYQDLMAEIGENVKNITNSLDIWPIVWHNVLLVVPMRVVSPGAEAEVIKGDGWEFISAENNQKEV